MTTIPEQFPAPPREWLEKLYSVESAPLPKKPMFCGCGGCGLVWRGCMLPARMLEFVTQLSTICPRCHSARVFIVEPDWINPFPPEAAGDAKG